MDQTSDQLKADIGRTRDEMGDTVEALAHKADVPTRTKEWLGDKKEAVASKVSGASSKVGELTPDGHAITQSMGNLRSTAERNPLGLAVAGAAVGFVAGVLLPSTRMEDERLGPMADEVKSTAADTGREALERGKTVVQEAGSTAVEAAKTSGEEQGEELAASLRDQAGEVMARNEPQSASSDRPV
jgi:gas vesicle protein